LEFPKFFAKLKESAGQFFLKIYVASQRSNSESLGLYRSGPITPLHQSVIKCGVGRQANGSLVLLSLDVLYNIFFFF